MNIRYPGALILTLMWANECFTYNTWKGLYGIQHLNWVCDGLLHPFLLRLLLSHAINVIVFLLLKYFCSILASSYSFILTDYILTLCDLTVHFLLTLFIFGSSFSPDSGSWNKKQSASKLIVRQQTTTVFIIKVGQNRYVKPLRLVSPSP